jgi:hypothetical protein
MFLTFVFAVVFVLAIYANVAMKTRIFVFIFFIIILHFLPKLSYNYTRSDPFKFSMLHSDIPPIYITTTCSPHTLPSPSPFHSSSPSQNQMPSPTPQDDSPLPTQPTHGKSGDCCPRYHTSPDSISQVLAPRKSPLLRYTKHPAAQPNQDQLLDAYTAGQIA